ncbi:MarR family transcriptional regulator [Listeria booriae]|uniref:MarR family transcriptional regulator n=1 Tax=Listeria booriae TaxID=1552123 RepID=A0A841Y5C6_9LIST|nr:MarR family transcriptional regulator [Listeria booriae]MBC1371557.1 MarR family transcriptional regulator [Listeria booriae]
MNKADQVMDGVRDLLNKMGWLNKFEMEVRLDGYKASEVHCIEAIEKTTDPNVTKLAQSLYMTRGAASKITKKLLKKGYIESYQKPDNKKEIYFRLTEHGQKIFNIHEEVHKQFQDRDKVVFEQVTDEQYDMLLAFMEKYNQHLDEEIRKQGLDIK